MVLRTLVGLFSSKTNMFLYLAIGLAVVSVGGYIYFLENQNDKKAQTIKEQTKALTIISNQLNNTILTNESNVKQFDEYKTKSIRTMQLLNTQHEKELKNTKQIVKIKEEIRYVEKKDDDVVAPVLSNVFSRLHQYQNRDTNSSNKNKNNKTPNPQ